MIAKVTIRARSRDRRGHPARRRPGPLGARPGQSHRIEAASRRSRKGQQRRRRRRAQGMGLSRPASRRPACALHQFLEPRHRSPARDERLRPRGRVYPTGHSFYGVHRFPRPFRFVTEKRGGPGPAFRGCCFRHAVALFTSLGNRTTSRSRSRPARRRRCEGPEEPRLDSALDAVADSVAGNADIAPRRSECGDGDHGGDDVSAREHGAAAPDRTLCANATWPRAVGGSRDRRLARRERRARADPRDRSLTGNARWQRPSGLKRGRPSRPGSTGRRRISTAHPCASTSSASATIRK